MGEALDFASRPDAPGRWLDPARDARHRPVTEITAPGVEVFYLFCDDIAAPPAGTIYRIWFGLGRRVPLRRGLHAGPAASTVLRLQFDPASVDQILITEEPSGSGARPSRRSSAGDRG